MEKEASKITKGTLVTGVIGEDVHVTGIRILEHALQSSGFDVVSLGIHNSRKDFVDAAKKANADAILISSLTGHANMLVDGLHDECISKGLNNIFLYIGGQLVINDEEWSSIKRRFTKMGFNRVYPPFVYPERVIEDLRNDLGLNAEKPQTRIA